MTDWTVQYLRHVLEKTKWSGNYLAERARISASTINRPANDPKWFGGLSARTVRKIAEASGISPGPFAPSGFSDQSAAFSGQAAENSIEPTSSRPAMPAGIGDPAANMPLNAVSLTVHDDTVSILARVDRDGLRRLRTKIDALIALFDD